MRLNLSLKSIDSVSPMMKLEIYKEMTLLTSTIDQILKEGYNNNKKKINSRRI
jgi:hypothetical protein